MTTCPCVPTNLAGTPTKGWCDFAMVFNIENGNSDGVKLDGLTFAVIGHAPEAMGKGNWSVGLIVDERASEPQKQAITTIASGQAGGPPAILTAVVGSLLGVESRPIHYRKDGLKRSVSIPKLLEQTCEGVPRLRIRLSRSTSRTRCTPQTHALPSLMRLRAIFTPSASIGTIPGQQQWPLRPVQLAVELTFGLFWLRPPPAAP